MRRTISFIGIMLASALVAHVAFSALVSAWIADRYQHRLFNVRNIEDTSQWGPLARLFVEGQALDDPRPKVLLIGSSFTWGYAWPTNDVFSWHLQKSLTNYQILNLGIVGFALNGYPELQCSLRDVAAEVELAVYEVNLFNVKFTSRWEQAQCNNSPNYTALGGYLNYIDYTISHTWGFDYFRAFWDNDVYEQDEQEYVNVNLPPSYFPDLAQFSANLDQLFDLLSWTIADSDGISKQSAILLAPTLRDGLEDAGISIDAFQEVIDDVVNLCHRIHETTCLNAGLIFSRPNFSNVTHLNLYGQKSFADWLLPRLPLHSNSD